MNALLCKPDRGGINKHLAAVLFSLNPIARCSSEELLDRLFKKSVVTEAEVIFLSHLKVQNRWVPPK